MSEKEGWSEEKEGFWGNKYTQHYDEDGNETGWSEEKEGFWGNKYSQSYDQDNKETGWSEENEGFWGNKYTQHYSDSESKSTSKATYSKSAEEASSASANYGTHKSSSPSNGKGSGVSHGASSSDASTSTSLTSVIVGATVLGVAVFLGVTLFIRNSPKHFSNTVASISGNAYVNTKQLNIRSEPGSEKNIVSKISRGTQVTLLQKTQVSDGGSWVKIRIGKIEGWVNEKLISSSSPVDESAKVESDNDNFGWQNIKGMIGQYKITMSFKESNGRVTGYYSYSGKEGRLRIEGNWKNDGSAVIYEYDSKGINTGIIKWQSRPVENDSTAILSGTWSSPDSRQSLPFKLEPIGD